MADIIDKEMLTYFMQLSEPEKKSIVQMLKTFLKDRKVDVDRISIDQYNNEIDEAMEEVRSGDTVSHAEVIKMAKNW